MSTKTKTLIIFILFAIALCTGCGKSADVKLTTAENGTAVNVKAGELIVISLEGNPGTGYNWEAKDLDTALFKQVGEPEFKSNNPDLVGSNGTISVTFKALKSGTAALNLVYHRSWEKDVAPLNTYSVTITVE